MGPIQRSDTRRDVVDRLIAHLREAKRMGCELVVFPELTLWRRNRRSQLLRHRPGRSTHQ